MSSVLSLYAFAAPFYFVKSRKDFYALDFVEVSAIWEEFMVEF